MSGNDHITEQLAVYALGALEEDERLEVGAHLAVCSQCRSELETYQDVTDQLAWGAHDATPPPELKQLLLEQVQASRLTPVDQSQPVWWRRLATLVRQPIPVWSLGLVSLILVLVLAGTLVVPLGGEKELRTIALVPTDAAPDATGLLVVSADGEYGSLVVDGLPDLDEEHQYQLWLIRDEDRSNGGIFSVHEGYAAMQIESAELLSSYDAFGITIEPVGGSAGPTGDKVLGSSP